MLLRLLILFSLSAFSIGAHSTIRNASDCSNGAIQTAVNAAVDGDTVQIPTCSRTTWTGDINIPNSKGLIIQGNGTANTIIGSGCHTMYFDTTTGRQPIRVTGIYFYNDCAADNNTPPIRFVGTAQNWRVDHNTIDDQSTHGLCAIQQGTIGDENGDNYGWESLITIYSKTETTQPAYTLNGFVGELSILT